MQRLLSSDVMVLKMIWKFDNTEAYLLGSVHAMRKEDNLHSSSINDIYNKVTKVVFETSLDITSQPLCFYDEDKLSKNISKTLFRDVKRVWLKYKLPYGDLEKSKIWQAANSIAFNILENEGFLDQYGIDRLLWEKSKKDQKTIELLESSETSLLSFDNAPIEEQRKYLAQVVRNKSKVIDQFNTIIQSWNIGDEETLSFVLRSCLEELPVMFNSLIVERNELWLNHFLSAFRSGVPTLFVVGVLHCTGEYKIQNMVWNPHGYNSEIINT